MFKLRVLQSRGLNIIFETKKSENNAEMSGNSAWENALDTLFSVPVIMKPNGKGSWGAHPVGEKSEHVDNAF